MSSKTESAAKLFARLNGHPVISNIEPKLFSSLDPGSVVEIYGEAGCGKTELLYYFIIQCIFPYSWNGIHFRGLNTGVIFIDIDYHFNLLRLIGIMEKRLYHLRSMNKKCTVITDSTISIFITERLRMLHIVRCSSTEQFLITLCSLENFLAANVNTNCLMIDSISAFYWTDRMNAMHQLKKLEDSNNKLISILKKLVDNYSLVIFVTKQNLMTKKIDKPSTVTEYDFMGRHWQKFVTHTIELSVHTLEDDKMTLNFSLLSGSEQKSGKCIIADIGFVL